MQKALRTRGRWKFKLNIGIDWIKTDEKALYLSPRDLGIWNQTDTRLRKTLTHLLEEGRHPVCSHWGVPQPQRSVGVHVQVDNASECRALALPLRNQQHCQRSSRSERRHHE